MSFRFFLIALVLQSSSFLIGTCRSFSVVAGGTSGSASTTANKAHNTIIQQGTWIYKGHPIGYEEAKQQRVEGINNKENESRKEPIFLLNGFGVGSFHQHRLMQRLLEQEKGSNNNSQQSGRAIFSMDYLGQGRSWPQDCNDGLSEAEAGLIYSGDTWVDQAIQFMEQVIIPQSGGNTTKVHLVGNSVGGHLAVFLAALRPDLVESVCLLNATPVWGLNLPGW